MKNKFKELKKLFNKYDIYTLDSLEILYSVSKQKLPLEFTIIQNKKFEENRDEFEGMNEYTYDTRLENFSLDEVIENLPNLTTEELKYITKLITNAIGSINPNQKEISIIPKLTDYIKKYNKEILERMSYVRDNISLSDLKSLFLKFHTYELHAFNDILEFANQDNMLDIKRIKNETAGLVFHRRKYNSIKRSKYFTIKDLIKKISELNNRQLEVLHTFVAEAAMNLNINVNLIELEEEEFERENAIYQDVIEFLTAIEQEQESRKEIRNYKVKC